MLIQPGWPHRIAAVLIAAALVAVWPPMSASAAGVVLVGAGDIAKCGSSGHRATAAIIRGISGTVFTTGDNVYEDGTATEFATCYAPTWGAFRTRTRPSPGNHDYHTAGAAGYFGYFGARAGDPSRGYYAYDLGAWRIYALNSNCEDVGGCHAGSPQERWLRADLAAHPHRCVAAYWHHPLFSSGRHGNQPEMRPFWDALYAARADIVINGHDHVYERFRRQSPTGRATKRGIQQFTVGTGGNGLYTFPLIRPNSEERYNRSYGVLRLRLLSTGWRWRFIPTSGNYVDKGERTCR